MQISIIGTGAMATLFAARLADVADVSMIGSWADALETIKQQGIVIDGDSCCHQVHTAYHPDDAPAADLALILTKAYKTVKASEVAAKTIKPDGLALDLAEWFGQHRDSFGICGTRSSAAGRDDARRDTARPGAHSHQWTWRDASGLRADRVSRAS